MSENSPINWHRLDLVTDNDRELGKEFVLFFLDNMKIYLADLSEQLENGDEFTSICHKIKGAAKTVGADLTAELSLKGESMSQEPAGERTKLYEEIKLDVDNIRKTII